jgi:hypothetical protein
MDGLMMNCLRLKLRCPMACIFAVATTALAPIMERSDLRYLAVYTASEMILRYAIRSGVKAI